MQPFLDSTDVSANGGELQRRMERDGYLFIRQVLPAEVLESLRRQLLAIAREAGWARTDTPPEQGVADLNGFCVEPEPRYMEVYHRMYRLPEFQALQHHPNLIGLLERMLGGPVIPHPRFIGRTIFPQREAYTTPPHQDFIPIQGTAETYTAWIPASDVTPEMGGLTVCAGSHQHGVYRFRPALGAGGIEVSDALPDAWVHSPMRQGDVLFFHSLMVHKGMPCHGERLRMSFDARYQRLSDPIAPDSLEPHGKLITWEEVYADWPPGGLQYYWRQWDLQFKAYDPSYHQQRDRLAFEMAEAGDERARSTLQRIISRDPDPAKRERAEHLLARLDAAG